MFPATQVSLRAIVDLAPDAILVVDQQSAVVFANSQAGTLFGYPLTELSGKPLEALIPVRFHETHRNNVRGFTASPHTRSMGEGLDILAIQREGQEIPVDIKLSPLTLDGEPFVIAVVRDITQFRALERQLRESIEVMEAMNIKLVALNEEKDLLLGTAAHDLRNPLHALLLGTESLILKIQNGYGIDAAHPLLSNIRATLRYMTHLVDSLLDIAAITTGKLRLDLAPMKVEDRIEECRILMEGVALERGVLLDVC